MGLACLAWTMAKNGWQGSAECHRRSAVAANGIQAEGAHHDIDERCDRIRRQQRRCNADGRKRILADRGRPRFVQQRCARQSGTKVADRGVIEGVGR